jgi:hypothetical protein
MDISIQLISSFALGQAESGLITLKGHMVDARSEPENERDYENLSYSTIRRSKGFGILMRLRVSMKMSRERCNVLILR